MGITVFRRGSPTGEASDRQPHLGVDPDVVEAFQEREQALRALQLEFARLAALN